MQQVGLRRPLVVAVAVVSAALLSACSSAGSSTLPSGNASLPSGQPGKGKPAVTLGTKNFTEQFVLGELYTQALRAKGYTVNLRSDIGTSEDVDPQLTKGRIDLYPEYTGVIVTAVAKLNSLTAPGAPGQAKAPPRTAAQAYHQAADFESDRGLKLLNPTPFENADRVATTPEYAKQHGLSTMKDLKKLGSFSWGAPPENRKRFEGLVGLKQAYGVNDITFVAKKIGDQYDALRSGQVNTIAVFTTDGRLSRGQYAVLSDPKHVFGFQNVAPVVRKKVIKREGPEFARVLNAVSAKLTTSAIQKMNAEVDLDHKKPQEVAQEFLSANHLT